MPTKNLPTSRTYEFRRWILAEIAKLSPDSCLPPDREFGAQWQLSTITIQRILAKLRDQGKLVRIPGKGTFTPGLKKTEFPSLQVKKDVSKESSVEHLIKGLVRLISQGTYRQGNALPPVKFIRNQFKVSSETVTLAYQKMEQLGYVEKVGKSYWIGRLEQLLSRTSRQEVFFFSFDTNFQDIFQSNPIALSFQKMERGELYNHGYFLHPESTENLNALAQEWERMERYPSGMVFHGVTPAHIPFFQNFFSRFPGILKARASILIYGKEGDLSDLNRYGHVVSQGNVDTNIARAMAHYLLTHGYQEANFCLDEADLTGPAHFEFFFKIALAAKSVIPGFVFRFIVKAKPDSEGMAPLFRSMTPAYRKYLEAKYPAVRLASLEEHFVFTTSPLETCIAHKDAKIWMFSTSERAAEALTWLRRNDVKVPREVAVVSLQNDPRHYHFGISTCIPDWDQMGYVMANALMGNAKLAHSTKGFLKVRCQVMDKLTTQPVK